jgi:hypothetical protein
MLALKQRAGLKMVDILCPSDFPDAWKTACGHNKISPLQEAKAMAGTKTSPEAQKYFKVCRICAPIFADMDVQL